MAADALAPPVLGYPEKFELALRYGESNLMTEGAVTDGDRLLLDALSRQATLGPCNEPRPSIFDSVARARHAAWAELGNRSKMEAMFMYVQAVEALAPDWWTWPELGLLEKDDEQDEPRAATSSNGVPDEPVSGAAGDGNAREESLGTEVGAAVRITPLCRDAFGSPMGNTAPAQAPEGSPSQTQPEVSSLQLNLRVGDWSRLEVDGTPARYRHSCALVGARLFMFGGRSNSGRLASGLHVLDMLTGKWSAASVSGATPELRWGHSMNAFRQWLVIFGGHRQRGSFSDTPVFDTQAMAWVAPQFCGNLPPARGNHAAAVCMQRLWIFGGDGPPPGEIVGDLWCLPLDGVAGAVNGSSYDANPLEWEKARTSGTAPPVCHDHAAVACGSRVLLIGGSSSSGYVSLAKLWVLDVDQLTWTNIHCSGEIPSPRAGHRAAALRTNAGGWNIYMFGGGASATGFDDLHVLDQDWKWKRLTGSSGAANGSQPPATEGAAMTVSGNMLLVCGGYTSAGATRACFAWGCETTPVEDVVEASERRGQNGRAKGSLAQTLMVLSCPSRTRAEAHAQAAQAALTNAFAGLKVVAMVGSVNARDASVDAKEEEATSQEQALAMVEQRMESIQLCKRSMNEVCGSSSLSQAHVAGIVQPCQYKIMTAGRPRVFLVYWVGLIDLHNGRRVVAASASREVRAAAASWGRGAVDELDKDGAIIVTHAWRTLIKCW